MRREVSPEVLPSEALRSVAREMYQLFDVEGEIQGRDLIARMKEPAQIEAAVEVLAVEMAPEEAPTRLSACLEVLQRAAMRKESKSRTERLKSATGAEQDELLRQAIEARRRRPRDHGLLPGR